MRWISQYPLIGYLLTIAGGILVVWYFARPKAKRPFHDVAELRDPLPTTTYQDGKAGISVPECALDWSGDDSPALKVQITHLTTNGGVTIVDSAALLRQPEVREAIETINAIETPSAPVVKIKRTATQKRDKNGRLHGKGGKFVTK